MVYYPKGMRFLAILLFLPSVAFGEDWSTKDTIRQGVFTGITMMDWAQTRYIAKHPIEFRETNPVLGKHPSIGSVNNYFAVSIIGHAAVSYMLPAGAWREGWQYVWIGIEVGAVAHNYSMGIRMSF